MKLAPLHDMDVTNTNLNYLNVVPSLQQSALHDDCFVLCCVVYYIVHNHTRAVLTNGLRAVGLRSMCVCFFLYD